MPNSHGFKLVLSLSFGALLSAAWYHYQHPVRPLYVDLYNGTAATLPEVAITHGTANLQSRIQALRISPGEHRIVALNHRPGMGFNVDATLADGSRFSICAGKDDARFIGITVSAGGLVPHPLR